MRTLAILTSLALAGIAQARVWTDSQDRRIEAELVSVTDTHVVLRLEDGREIPYPLEKLSRADQDFVKNWRQEKPENLPDGSDKNPGPPSARKLNFDRPWPDRVTFSEDPEITTIEENADEKRFIYESANYRYVCDVRLAKSVVKGFAVLFEATNLACATLPLSLNGGSPEGKKHQILLFETREAYVKAGGPPSSGGVFISGGGREPVVMVPLTSLGVRPVGSSYMLDRDRENGTLPHELTHQLTPGAYFQSGCRGWFTEGIAEYLCYSPYRSGSFNFRNNLKPFVQVVTSHGKDGYGSNLGDKIILPALRQFMLQTYEEFLADSRVNYGASLLITAYFCHMDGEGDAKRLKNFLKGMLDGKTGAEALEPLLDGRTFQQLEKDIIKAYKREGVEFTFMEEDRVD